MNNFKIYIIRIIVLCAMVQFGAFFVDNDGFKRLYKLIVSILLIMFIANVPTFKNDLSQKINTHEYNVVYEDRINEKFTENVEKMIINDLKTRYSLEFFRVVVESDYTKITITIYGYFSESDSEIILNYIWNTYCTENDEVIINNGLS